jgi:tetratricopeptide (TPR) repeat protein
MSKAKPKPVKAQVKQAKSTATSGPDTKRLSVYFMIAIVVVTWICFAPGLKNELTNWDDPVYVTDNALIKDLNKETVKTLFAPSTAVSLNYHPLTMLTLAMNYSSSGLEAKGYILTNIVIHIITSLLLFVFIRMLTRGRVWIAGVVSLLFAIHPMHVESVVWVSERKDVLYVFFFVAGLITYMRYLDTKRIVFIIVTLLLFLLSCLSKAMAVVFPVALLLIDFYYDRKINVKNILEKIPFFIISVVIGYKAVSIQSTEAINEFSTFTLWERIMFASYGFVMYIAKLFAPLRLSAFYPYPHLDETGDIPGYYALMPVILIAVLAAPFLIYRRNKELGKVLIFGIGFYLIAVALVLQFISVGSAIMAERYTYLSYIGLFFILAWLIDKYLVEKRNSTMAMIITFVAVGFFAFLCRERVKVWKNSETLWTDVINKYPVQVPTAYKNRSLWYIDHQQVDKAYNDLMIMTKLPQKDPGGFNNLGNIYSMRQEYEKALEAYTAALKLDNRIFDAHLNRAITYSMLKQYDNAFKGFAEAEKLNANSPKLYQNRAYTYFSVGKYEESIRDYDRSIAYEPQNSNFYFYRGLAKFNLAKYPDAIADFEKATSFNPKFSEAYHNMSVAYNRLDNAAQAYQAELKAQSLGFATDAAYLEQLKKKAGQ